MSDTIIKVEHVSMQFNLGIDKGFSLKQFFVDSLSGKAFKKKKAKQDNLFWALSDVNFEISRGEVVGLIGSNGAGKSTMLKVVAGVLKPTRGKISVYGNICPMIELGAGFDVDLTARENIFLNGAVMGYSKEFIQSKFDEIVAGIGEEMLPDKNEYDEDVFETKLVVQQDDFEKLQRVYDELEDLNIEIMNDIIRMNDGK